MTRKAQAAPSLASLAQRQDLLQQQFRDLLAQQNEVVKLASDESRIKRLAGAAREEERIELTKLSSQVARMLNVFLEAGEAGRYPTRAEVNQAVADGT